MFCFEALSVHENGEELSQEEDVSDSEEVEEEEDSSP